jgi:threonyl-tRNA synthetase
MVYNKLKADDIRGILDDRDEKIGRKIRDAETKKVPYMLIVGEKEASERLVSVRKHGQGDQGSVSLEDFALNFKLESAAPE